MPPRVHDTGGWELYAPSGLRKYLNRAERERALKAAAILETGHALFVMTLLWSGARVSEVLALTASSFQVDSATVSIRTLKRRRRHIREVPIPPGLMVALDRHFGLRELQRDAPETHRRLWPWHRSTAWRLVKRVMRLANVSGLQASPRGFRHGFGVGTLAAGIPLNLTQRWLGHARMETTAIYAGACGAEEIAIARRFWDAGGCGGGESNLK